MAWKKIITATGPGSPKSLVNTDLFPGDTGIILGAETWVFDPDDPVNSKETVYRCLVNGAIQHLFDHDFEFYTMTEVAVS